MAKREPKYIVSLEGQGRENIQADSHHEAAEKYLARRKPQGAGFVCVRLPGGREDRYLYKPGTKERPKRGTPPNVP